MGERVSFSNIKFLENGLSRDLKNKYFFLYRRTQEFYDVVWNTAFNASLKYKRLPMKKKIHFFFPNPALGACDSQIESLV